MDERGVGKGEGACFDLQALMAGELSPSVVSTMSANASASHDTKGNKNSPTQIGALQEKQGTTPQHSKVPVDEDDKSSEVKSAIDWLFGKTGLGEECGMELRRRPGAEEELERLGIRLKMRERIQEEEAHAKQAAAGDHESPAPERNHAESTASQGGSSQREESEEREAGLSLEKEAVGGETHTNTSTLIEDEDGLLKIAWKELKSMRVDESTASAGRRSEGEEHMLGGREEESVLGEDRDSSNDAEESDTDADVRVQQQSISGQTYEFEEEYVMVTPTHQNRGDVQCISGGETVQDCEGSDPRQEAAQETEQQEDMKEKERNEHYDEEQLPPPPQTNVTSNVSLLSYAVGAVGAAAALAVGTIMYKSHTSKSTNTLDGTEDKERSRDASHVPQDRDTHARTASFQEEDETPCRAPSSTEGRFFQDEEKSCTAASSMVSPRDGRSTLCSESIPPLRRQTTSEWAKALASGTSTVAAVALRSVYRMYCVNRFGNLHRSASSAPVFVRHGRPQSRAAAAIAAGNALRGMGVGGRGGAGVSRAGSDQLHLDSLCAGLASVIYNTGARGEFEALGFHVVRIEEQDAKKMHPKWAVLKHPALSIVVVVFRGTYSAQDVLADIRFKPKELACGVVVNGGMLSAVQLCVEGIKSALRETLQDAIKHRLVICGHSYGGACAQILRVLMLTSHGWSPVMNKTSGVEVVTFGAPLVFGQLSYDNKDGGSRADSPSSQARRGSARDSPRSDVPGDEATEQRPPQTHARSTSETSFRTQILSGKVAVPPPVPAAPSSPRATLRAVGALSRHYIHQCDVIPRLLGPRSADLLTKMMEGQTNQRGVEAAAQVADLVGKYIPVGTFRVVYTEGAGGQRERNIVCEVADEEGIQSLLEPAPLLYLPHAVLDHDSSHYRDKLNAACSDGADVIGP